MPQHAPPHHCLPPCLVCDVCFCFSSLSRDCSFSVSGGWRTSGGGRIRISPSRQAPSMPSLSHFCFLYLGLCGLPGLPSWPGSWPRPIHPMAGHSWLKTENFLRGAGVTTFTPPTALPWYYCVMSLLLCLTCPLSHTHTCKCLHGLHTLARCSNMLSPHHEESLNGSDMEGLHAYIRFGWEVVEFQTVGGQGRQGQVETEWWVVVVGVGWREEQAHCIWPSPPLPPVCPLQNILPPLHN